MKIAQNFFLLFIFLKQFYIFDSGFVQPGDVFLILSFILYLIVRESKVIINKVDKPLIIFVICIALINGLYFTIYKNIGFIMPILYYIFNLIVVVLFRDYIKDKVFLSKLFNILKLNIITQFMIYILGLGSWYSEGRYMGTFNDPNQMAFFIFMMLLLMVLTSNLLNKSVNAIFHLLTIFLIIETASTGIFVALIVFYILLFLYYFSKINFGITLKQIFILISLFIISIIALTIIDIDFQEIRNENFIIARVEEKLSKLSNPVINNTSNYTELSIIQERGIDKLFLYPEKVLFGAGEGLYWRFSKAAHMGEIHSTLPSILFYYGIIPFILLLVWFRNNLKKINQTTVIIFIPLLIESFTLLNQRQPFFWMIFVLAFELYRENEFAINKYTLSHNQYKNSLLS